MRRRRRRRPERPQGRPLTVADSGTAVRHCGVTKRPAENEEDDPSGLVPVWVAAESGTAVGTAVRHWVAARHIENGVDDLSCRVTSLGESLDWVIPNWHALRVGYGRRRMLPPSISGESAAIAAIG